MREKFARVRLRYFRHLLRRSSGDDFTAVITRFRAEIHNPIRAFDDFEVVLDHHDRMSATDQSLEQTQQHRDVVEMQSGRRLVEDKEIANTDTCRVFTIYRRFWTLTRA